MITKMFVWYGFFITWISMFAVILDLYMNGYVSLNIMELGSVLLSMSLLVLMVMISFAFYTITLPLWKWFIKRYYRG